MFGTAGYYGVMSAVLYPAAVKKRREGGKWDEF